MRHQLLRLVAVVGCGVVAANSAAADNTSRVAAGYEHTCALTPDGTVLCWGYNASGQLGDGTTTNRSTPAVVSGLPNGVALAVAAGGYHTCALTPEGGVVCWGDNFFGQLGDGTTDPRSVPVTTGIGVGAASVVGGYWHTCALMAEGSVFCWGLNSSGQLGDGTTTSAATPRPSPLADVGVERLVVVPSPSWP